jgi:PAS domain S-box-containing protein
LPDVAAMVEQTETRIVDGSNKPVHFSFEYLEPSSSFADASRQRATASYLLEKYRAQTFDLVIAIDEETVAFAETIRAKLFPDGALLFFLTDPQEPSSWLNPKRGRTGVIRMANYLSTLQLALRQNPGTSHVTVISGSSEDERAATRLACEQFRPYEANIEFQYLTDLAFSELGPRLEHTPPHGVIMFLDFVTDSGGEHFIPARILPIIAQKANRPIYGMFSSLVGAGVVGGSVADLGEVGRVLGNDGLRILKGEKPEKVPVTTSDFQHYVIDWRQLHRWAIPETEIPKEGEVRFWQYSPWELYRWRILGLTALLLMETLLIVLLLRNIAKRKAAEGVRSRLAAIVESSDDPVISENLDGIILSWNRAAERIFGFSEADAVGQPITILVPPELREEEKTILRKVRAGEKIEHYETVRVTKEGKKINVSLTISPVRDAMGRIVGASKIARDVTDRKRAEQALQESETRFRLMANTAPVMIWTSGPVKLRDYFNQPWLDFTGRPLSAEIGNGWTEGVHPDDLASCLDTNTKAFDARQPFEMEYRIRRHDGEYRWIFDAAVPRVSGDNSFAGYIGSCIDVTDRKLAEEALSSIGRKLMEGQEKERSRIARELHDDINQRLALLANGLQEFEQAASVQNSSSRKKQLRELWQLTSEIATDIQHMSHQLHPSKLHYLGLAAAVRDLCHEVSVQHKIEVECLAANLPEDIDENASLSLFRVVQESLRNVTKHSHARHVKVELTCQSSALNVRVSDDGVGFSPEDRREKHGLGFISMRERLRSVGGEFSIWSKPSLGTQVEGRVPVTKKPVRRAEESAAD